MSIFSNTNAIIITGAKHGTTQLQHSAATALGTLYSPGHDNPFIKRFDYKKLSSLMRNKLYGQELLKELNFPLTNTYFNRVNFVYDLTQYKNKPIVILIRNPLKAAEASIIEDLYMLLTNSSGYLTAKDEIFKHFYNFHGSGPLDKVKLTKCSFLEDLFFTLNKHSLILLENEDPATILPHTEYLHLLNITDILNFFNTHTNRNLIHNTFIVDMDNLQDEEVKKTLDEDGILVRDTPRASDHSTKDLKEMLPNFLNEIGNENIIYKRRLLIEEELYKFTYDNYKDNIFNLEKYKEVQQAFKNTIKNIKK